jgi:D-aminoacyl-tRNA deacylase
MAEVIACDVVPRDVIPASAADLHRPTHPGDAAGSHRPSLPPKTMLALIQRVTEAKVVVDGDTVGAIGPGLLALVGVEPGDGPAQVAKLGNRLLRYRVFSDDAGKMNLSLADTGGGLLLVSQFTLAADTSSGLRPSFSTAAAPAEAEQIFGELAAYCRLKHSKPVETGRFGAHMIVSLVNDGPVTFLLRA